MTIRVASADDVAALAQIHVLSWQQAYRGLLPDEYLDSLRWTQRIARWRELIAGQDPPGSATLVVAEDDEVLGFAHVGPTRDDDNRGKAVGELVSIYLRPDAWGRGLGRGLLGDAIALLKQAGNLTATLWVLEGNARAIRFYESNGWTPDGARKQATIAGHPVTEIRYRIGL